MIQRTKRVMLFTLIPTTWHLFLTNRTSLFHLQFLNTERPLKQEPNVSVAETSTKWSVFLTSRDFELTVYNKTEKKSYFRALAQRYPLGIHSALGRRRTS